MRWLEFDVRDGAEVEDSELPALKQLVAMGYEYVPRSELNKVRQDYRMVLLYDRLENAIRRLNPELNDESVKDALSQIGEDAYPYELDPMETNERIRAKMIELSKSGGLDPIVVTQDFGNGPAQKFVRLFDFEHPENNNFLVTNQFRLNGFKDHILLDIVVFVNGIPLVIMECKSSGIPDPIGEAADRKNFYKYQQRKKGYERLFFYNHCLVVTCGISSWVGTIGSSSNDFVRWSDSYPSEDDDVEKLCGTKPREQEILIAGLLSKKNVLSQLQNFVLYDTVNTKRIKRIAKHQQFRAVMKCADRLEGNHGTDGRGGVIWHTQGSGKSFSMLWFATQIMYGGNHQIVIVTDRKQLDRQIHDTFKKYGFPDPVQAESGKHLKELLEVPGGKTIMTVIDKFATKSKILTEEKIVCLVDEAHRSQYGINANRMKESMPNAVFYAFTGTPITKFDKNTYRVFGPLLDKYGFKESQKDGSTLEIRYEGRLPELFITEGGSLDNMFDDLFSDVDPRTKDELKKRYANKERIAEAPERIERIASDLIEHYKNHIEPNGYKAMLVTQSREAAVLYKRKLDGLGGPPSKIIMTSNLGERGRDDHSWDEYHIPTESREHEAEKFKSPDDPTKILIVVDMLLVGYDVPICQVMYLDRVLREHNLLQAIARVNRRYDEPKSYGLIVDYSGITRELKSALEMFDILDVKDAMVPLDELITEVEKRHKKVMGFFAGVDRKDKSKIIERFESQDRRDSFEYEFKMFTRALDAILPEKGASKYTEDFKFLSQARQAIHTYYGQEMPNVSSYAKKIQKLIDDHIGVTGITELIDPTEVTYENFLSIVNKREYSKKAQAALIKNKARQVIGELRGSNPAYYKNLSDMLEGIILEEERRRKTNAEYFTDPDTYKEIYCKALSEEKERKRVFGDYDATPFEFSMYGEINEITGDKEKSVSRTREIFPKIRAETQIVEWKRKPSVEKKMTEIIHDALVEDVDCKAIDGLSIRIITLAKSWL